MAKFCGNCGTQLEDNAKICGQCGTPLDGTSSNIPGLKVVDPEKKKKMKKVGKRIVALVALVIVAVIAFNVVSQFTGYSGLLRKVMAAYEKYDIDTLISLSSDIYFYGDEDWVENYFEYNVGDDLDSFESAVGHSYKLSYEVIETYKLSNRNFQSMLDDIAWSYKDFDHSVIEEIVVAKVNVTATQGKRSVDREVEITMTKENGNWKVLYIE